LLSVHKHILLELNDAKFNARGKENINLVQNEVKIRTAMNKTIEIFPSSNICTSAQQIFLLNIFVGKYVERHKLRRNRTVTTANVKTDARM